MAYRRTHRGKRRTPEAWAAVLADYKAQREAYLERAEAVREAAYNAPVTEEDWQQELARRSRLRQHGGFATHNFC